MSDLQNALQAFSLKYNLPASGVWNDSEANNIRQAFAQSQGLDISQVPQLAGITDPYTEYLRNQQSAADEAQHVKDVTNQRAQQFKDLVGQYQMPGGRQWYSNEISNIQNAFMQKYGVDQQTAQEAMNNAGYGAAAFNQAPADMFPEGQRKSSNDLGTILALAGLGFGGASLLGMLGGGASAGLGWGLDGVAGDSLASWLGGSAAGAGGVGSAITSIPATGGGSGGNMSWLDSVLGDTGSDWASGLDTAMNSGSAAGGSNSVSIPGLDWDTPPSGVNTTTAPNLGTRQGVMQALVDRGMSLEAAGALNPSQLMNAAKLLGYSGGGSSTNGSSLSNILSGKGNTSDWTSLLGTLGTGALSAYSANQNASALKDIADRSWNAGAPYRNMLSDTYTNPGAYLNSPDVKAITDRATNSLARSLSARDGNPVGSGRALTEIQDYGAQTMLGQLGNYRQQLANFGGQSQLTGNYPQLGSNAADASSNIYNSLANTVSRATAPQTDWQSIMKAYGGANGLA